MDGISYLEKLELQKRLDNLILKELVLLKKFDGQVCKKCGFVLGGSNKGVKKYYCEHVSKVVDDKLKAESESLTGEIMPFQMCQ